jgi:putative FmdB family regulatory protein
MVASFQGFPAMPIYVYRCADCGEKFERLQKLSDPDPDVCPHCGKRHHVRRQVTAPAFRLAGSGWYETDFKSAREHKHNLAGDGDKPSPVASGNGAKSASSAGSSKVASD